MERRGFLKGMITSVAGSVATVRLATAEETQQLAKTPEVIVANAQPISVLPMMIENFGATVYLEVSGQLQPVGYLKSIEVQHRMERIESISGWAEYVPGLTRGMIHFGADIQR